MNPSHLVTVLFVFFLVGCEPPVDEPDPPTPPEPPESAVDGQGTAADEVPATEDTGTGEDKLRLDEHLARLNGLTVKGRVMRGSELGHPAYDDSLSGEPMAEVGHRWLALFETVQRFSDLGVLHPELDGDSGKGVPRLVDYADAAYVYHMHHSGGRFEDHGLFADLTHGPSAFLTQTGQRLLQEHFHEGRFHGQHGSAAEMAYGLDAFHGLAYAWVRWHKPGGEDDMGQIEHDVMIAWMGHDYPELLEVARQSAATLDSAWDSGAGAYDLGDGLHWPLADFASLIRGHKGLYELLYVFGTEEDRELAETLFERAADMVGAVLDEDLIRPWGLPAAVEFSDGRASAASVKVDVEAQWRLVHHLTGGFAMLREQDGTAQFIERTRPELAEHIGQAIDRLLKGALEHHMQEQTTANTLDYESGEVREADTRIGAASAFVMAAGNGYRAGNAFDRPGSWDDDADLAERSRALYDAILSHGRLLTDESDSAD
ncbi:hypothetical protein IC757_08215 [Wenzhouxiangella sp. AB-CW3]|uniref:hypothetical protein n=1 Tax=Wenzhouxiangella sp. AB-CW3 TaxID=2771012 RepID=UPI00168B77BE|nr:hypothetical protein [Wenzhouxiangella sp. AB-CW3]QOC24072.1 hypothetical protein IC757_08215 [Wenzhouxiangella sp. AB-CW3]